MIQTLKIFNLMIKQKVHGEKERQQQVFPKTTFEVSSADSDRTAAAATVAKIR